MRFRHRHGTGVEDMAAVARQVIGALPERVRSAVKNVAIHVVEFPDAETLDEMSCETPYDLLGLYRGISLAHRSVLDPTEDQDRVFLYRAAILDYCRETGEAPSDVVRHVVIHELGHHFGFSDEDMARIEDED